MNQAWCLLCLPQWRSSKTFGNQPSTPYHAQSQPLTTADSLGSPSPATTLCLGRSTYFPRLAASFTHTHLFNEHPLKKEFLKTKTTTSYYQRPTSSLEPSNSTQALKDTQWGAAMVEEFTALVRNNTKSFPCS